jgi:pterin-4a-carbinolamine dehydratase
MCEMNEDKTAIDKNTLIQNIKHLDGWSLKKRDTIIERNFTFNNFKDITLFLNHLINTINTLNHHPDFSLDTSSRIVFVSLTTHSEGCITQSDMDFASELNKHY